jgi:5-methylcytosine-specific restriction endonuclease McrBC GTP-binding regulatory subunit McrB
MSEQVKPIQKILFGSPGTGKSYEVLEIAKRELGIPFDEDTKILANTIKTVFHPEYTYADFMGKLLPLTQGGSVIYKFYPGHFLRILGMAYKALINESQENFLLVIDELNRGNAAAIFGTVFQLLDRESDGWSSYEVDISDMELFGLLNAMGLNPIIQQNGSIDIDDNGAKMSYKRYFENKANILKTSNFEAFRICSILKKCQIKIPTNLSIIATINTSDESIYYLDSAFKRRWDWQFIRSPSGTFYIENENIPLELKAEVLSTMLTSNNEEKYDWKYCVIGINEFIKLNYQSIRRIEDKQIGWWFIKPENGKIELQQVKDKLMFYLWDSVFTRDKKALEDFLSDGGKMYKLRQYSDFLDLTEDFMDKIYQLGKNIYVNNNY